MSAVQTLGREPADVEREQDAHARRRTFSASCAFNQAADGVARAGAGLLCARCRSPWSPAAVVSSFGYPLQSIDLPSTPRHSRGPSSATTASNSSVGSEGAAQLEDEALLAALEEAYRAFRLLHGSFERLSEQGREAMVESLQEYWEAWTKGWNVSNEGSFERILGGELIAEPGQSHC